MYYILKAVLSTLMQIGDALVHLACNRGFKLAQ